MMVLELMDKEAGSKDEDTLLADPTQYQRLVGRLLYLTMTRIDIAYVVQVLSQFMHSPKQSHMNAALRVVKYIKNAPGLGLLMPSEALLKQSLEVWPLWWPWRTG